MFAYRHVQRRVVVEAALIWIGSERQEQLDNVDYVRSSRRTWLGPAARQRRNQRWKSGVIRRVRIGADLDQCANERQWAMVNGVLEAGPDRKRHRPIRQLSGSSTAARRAVRSPTRKALSILLNFSYSAHRSVSDFIAATTCVYSVTGDLVLVVGR